MDVWVAIDVFCCAIDVYCGAMDVYCCAIDVYCTAMDVYCGIAGFTQWGLDCGEPTKRLIADP